MKVTMYMDLPPYVGVGHCFFAANNSPSGPLAPGYKRVAFQVELPVKMWDEALPPVTAYEAPAFDRGAGNAD